MEMQQQFHAVNMNGSASDQQLALSSSASTNHDSTSTTSSSCQSSPAANNFSMSPPPSHSTSSPPDLQQAEHSIRFSPDPREQALKSRNESIPHSLALRRLRKSDLAHQKDASSHKKSVRRLSKELYLIVSLYAVLQGAIFTAVAQSSVFTCTDFWGLMGIVIFVTLGTFAGAVDKLRRMRHEKQEVEKFEGRQSAVYDKIELLYLFGSQCNVEDLEPAYPDAFEAQPGVLCVFSARGLLVLGFLVGFSCLIIVSCHSMLCRGCHCH